jgi:hypothetical protein
MILAIRKSISFPCGYQGIVTLPDGEEISAKLSIDVVPPSIVARTRTDILFIANATAFTVLANHDI